MPRTPEWQQGYNVATKFWQTRYNLLKLQTTRAENMRADAQSSRDALQIAYDTLQEDRNNLQAEYDQYRIDHP